MVALLPKDRVHDVGCGIVGDFFPIALLSLFLCERIPVKDPQLVDGCIPASCMLLHEDKGRTDWQSNGDHLSDLLSDQFSIPCFGFRFPSVCIGIISRLV